MAFENPFSRAMPLDRAARWETSRKRGKGRFVLLRGILGWGGFMTIVMSIFQHLMHPKALFWSQIVPLNLAVHSIGGLLFGLWMWHSNERAYSRFKKETEMQLPPSNS